MENIDKNNYIFSKDGRKLYRTFCSLCNKDLGYQRNRGDKKHCRSCSAKSRNNNHLLTKEVRGKARLACIKRKDLDHTDCIVHSSGGKRYAHKCNECGEKHYIASSSKTEVCRKCYLKQASTRDKIRHKIKQNIRSNLNHRLKYRNISKQLKPSFKCLGYSPEDLRKHLESKFEPGMTWDNYGEWEIDHITPDSWFNYYSTDDEEFKKSWGLNNLQPMWAKENRSKSNKYSGKALKEGE